MKLVVWNSSLLDRCRRSVHKALGRVKDVELHTSSHQEVTQCLEDIRVRRSWGRGQGRGLGGVCEVGRDWARPEVGRLM